MATCYICSNDTGNFTLTVPRKFGVHILLCKDCYSKSLQGDKKIKYIKKHGKIIGRGVYIWHYVTGFLLEKK